MSGYLSEDLYKSVTQNVPIICVDTIPVVKIDDQLAPGMIVRATGSQAGKLTVLGGRIFHSERIQDAMHRHLKTDLSVDSFTYFNGLSEEKPFMVQQYFMQDRIDSDQYGFDPTKHALALTYLLMVDPEQINPQNEASDILWITEKIQDYSTTGFNQAVVINKALDFLANNQSTCQGQTILGILQRSYRLN